MAGLMDEEPPAEPEVVQGELTHQESKVFDGESFLCNVYEHLKKAVIVFEVYGLEHQATFSLSYSISDFDALFRFNAELMNPNKKEGRYNWVISRLVIGSVAGKEQEQEQRLELGPKPTEEVPQLPEYETNRKIPTGRMDLKERQRLREQMDMLEIRRTENILKKRQAHKERFLQHIFLLKETYRQKQEEVQRKIDEERRSRFALKEQSELKEAEEQALFEEKQCLRNSRVEVKEQRTKEQDEEEYRQLRQRWREKDAQEASRLRSLHEAKEAEREEARRIEEQKKRELAAMESRREVQWDRREQRIRLKKREYMERLLSIKQRLERKEMVRLERNATYAKRCQAERTRIFEAQLRKTAEREKAIAAEKEATAEYIASRALPKKVKKAPKTPTTAPSRSPPATQEDLERSGSMRLSRENSNPEKLAKAADPESIMDEVEAKIRADLAEQERRAAIDAERRERIQEMEQARQEREMQHMKQYREEYRLKQAEKERQAAQRRIIIRQRVEDRKMVQEAQQQGIEKLEKLRRANLQRKEEAWLERVAASAA